MWFFPKNLHVWDTHLNSMQNTGPEGHNDRGSNGLFAFHMQAHCTIFHAGKHFLERKKTFPSGKTLIEYQYKQTIIFLEEKVSLIM